jgi:hypothetical protein
MPGENRAGARVGFLGADIENTPVPVRPNEPAEFFDGRSVNPIFGIAEHDPVFSYRVADGPGVTPGPFEHFASRNGFTDRFGVSFFAEVSRQRLFHDDMLACFRRPDGEVMMKERRNADIDYVDVRAQEQLFEARRHKGDAVFFRAGLGAFAIEGTYGGYFNLTVPKAPVIIEMKLRAGTGAGHADSYLFHSFILLSKESYIKSGFETRPAISAKNPPPESLTTEK